MVVFCLVYVVEIFGLLFLFIGCEVLFVYF